MPIKSTSRTSAQWAVGLTLGEMEIGIEEDTGRVKAGPGNWNSLDYLTTGIFDLDAVKIAIAAHLGQTDPHGDRGYTDTVVGGATNTSPVSSLGDTDTIAASTGRITKVNLQTDLVTDAFVAALTTVAGLISQQATNTAALAGLSTQATTLKCHSLATSTTTAASTVSDLFAATPGITPAVNDRALYIIDELYTNTSGADAAFAALMKINGLSLFSKGLVLPTTAAGLTYQVSSMMELIFGADSSNHTVLYWVTCWPASTDNSLSVPSIGPPLFDYRMKQTATASDWGAGIPSVERRVTLPSATGLGYRRLGSRLDYYKAPL